MNVDRQVNQRTCCLRSIFVYQWNRVSWVFNDCADHSVPRSRRRSVWIPAPIRWVTSSRGSKIFAHLIFINHLDD